VGGSRFYVPVCPLGIFSHLAHIDKVCPSFYHSSSSLNLYGPINFTYFPYESDRQGLFVSSWENGYGLVDGE
jgi:hypothetical protein